MQWPIEKGQKTNESQQNTTKKIKDRAARNPPQKKPQVNSGAPEVKTVHALHMTSVVLLLSDTDII